MAGRLPVGRKVLITCIDFGLKGQIVFQICDNVTSMCIKSLKLCLLGNFSCFFCHLLILKSTFLKNYFRNNIRVSNSLDPDQSQQKKQRLSADNTSRQRVKDLYF